MAKIEYMWRRRVFGGKRYGLEADTPNKREAQKIAQRFRDKGFSARVTKDKVNNVYLVWAYPVR